MKVPKFLTLEELIRDHERLCAEVEELKKQFEGHTHLYATTFGRMATEPPKPRHPGPLDVM